MRSGPVVDPLCLFPLFCVFFVVHDCFPSTVGAWIDRNVLSLNFLFCVYSLFHFFHAQVWVSTIERAALFLTVFLGGLMTWTAAVG